MQRTMNAMLPTAIPTHVVAGRWNTALITACENKMKLSRVSLLQVVGQVVKWNLKF